MGRVLTDEQVEAYRRDGIHFPVEVMSESEAGDLLSRFEAAEALHGGRLPARINQKPHLLHPWMNELIRHPRILDAVEDVLGPDLLCWGAQFFAKNARDPSYVSWHQDGTYWGLSSPDVVTAWVALTPSVRENGCMQVVPGTHRAQVEHVDTFADTNLLSRGQEIQVSVKPEDVVPVVLRPRWGAQARMSAPGRALPSPASHLERPPRPGLHRQAGTRAPGGPSPRHRPPGLRRRRPVPRLRCLRLQARPRPVRPSSRCRPAASRRR